MGGWLAHKVGCAKDVYDVCIPTNGEAYCRYFFAQKLSATAFLYRKATQAGKEAPAGRARKRWLRLVSTIMSAF